MGFKYALTDLTMKPKAKAATVKREPSGARNKRGLSWCYTSISDPLATPRVIRRSDNEERVAAARTPG